jgi:hypothetical protein
MATLETVPAEVHFQIFSYLSTATFSPQPVFISILGSADIAWNEIGIHPLEQLCATSKTLRNSVEAYCEHRLQHLLTVRPPGKGPETPFSLPYCASYLRYMAGRCTFCYERVMGGFGDHGAVDITLPVCYQCKRKFPHTRIIRWERAEEEYELPLEELKANCAWAPIEDPSDYYQGRRRGYVFDDRDILRHVKRRYGDLDVFFAAIEKKHWDKELELERMAKQCRWAREDIERRMTAGEAMVKRFVAEHQAMEKKRAKEKQRLCDELEARTGKREKMFRGLLDTFLAATAGPESRCDQTCESDSERLEEAMDRAVSKLVDWEETIQYRIKAEEKVAMEKLIQQATLYMENQATADVLRKYGLDSLVEPEKPKKHRRRDRNVLY